VIRIGTSALAAIIVLGSLAMALFGYACGMIALRSGWGFTRFFFLGLVLGPIGFVLTWVAHRRGPEYLRYAFVQYPAHGSGNGMETADE
jgi:hypothetical protein